MNDEPDKKTATPDTDPPNGVSKAQRMGQPPGDEPEAEAIVPEISFYFANPDISPSAFLKALNVEKVKRFTKEDEQRALSTIEHDTSGQRLWALMSQTKLPDAVERWIWPVAQERMKWAIGPDFDTEDMSATNIMQNLVRSLTPHLRSKEKVEAKKAENWLRIGICWLVERRSLQLWTVAEEIASAFFADTKKAKSFVNRAISKGSIKELRLSVATVSLGNDIVARSKSEMAQERRVSNGLRIKLTDAEKKIENLSTELAVTRAELVEQREAIKKIETQLENERHHWGHDLSATKARQRSLLGERIVPLLSTAYDAISEDPIAPHVAVRRIEQVLSIIKEADE